jgi:hypothetical protein
LPRDRDSDGCLIPGGERVAGEVLFGSTEGFSDNVVETGLPIGRRYDAAAELGRIRGLWARQANARPRASVAFHQNRSLRRGV